MYFNTVTAFMYKVILNAIMYITILMMSFTSLENSSLAHRTEKENKQKYDGTLPMIDSTDFKIPSRETCRFPLITTYTIMFCKNGNTQACSSG